MRQIVKGYARPRVLGSPAEPGRWKLLAHTRDVRRTGSLGAFPASSPPDPDSAPGTRRHCRPPAAPRLMPPPLQTCPALLHADASLALAP